MFAEKKPRPQRRLTAYNTRVRNLLKRHEPSSSRSARPGRLSLDDGDTIYSRASPFTTTRRSSSSVEPPQLFSFKLGSVVSPAILIPKAPAADVVSEDPERFEPTTLPRAAPSRGVELGRLDRIDETEAPPELHEKGQPNSDDVSPVLQESTLQHNVGPGQSRSLPTVARQAQSNDDSSSLDSDYISLKTYKSLDDAQNGSGVGEKSTSLDDYHLAVKPPVAEQGASPSMLSFPKEAESGLRFDANTSGNNQPPSLDAMTGLLPPVQQDPLNSPYAATHKEPIYPDPGDEQASNYGGEGANNASYDTSKPTCSLNLVCYRSGAKGCDLQQIHCVLLSRLRTVESSRIWLDNNKDLVYNDEQFFKEMRKLYDTRMSSFMRRWFSLKTHKAFRILSYTPTSRPVVVPLNDFILQEMMFAYLNPGQIESEDDWIQWVFRLRRSDRRHAVEFVEGWDTTRIAIAGTIPWLSSCIVGIAWTAAGGDVQSAFTVASFILTSSSIILALLAIISGIESSGPSRI